MYAEYGSVANLLRPFAEAADGGDRERSVMPVQSRATTLLNRCCLRRCRRCSPYRNRYCPAASQSECWERLQWL